MLKYHFLPIRLATILMPANRQMCRERGTLIHYWWDYKLAQFHRGKFGNLIKIIGAQTIWPSNPIFRNLVSRNTCFYENLTDVQSYWLQQYL